MGFDWWHRLGIRGNPDSCKRWFCARTGDAVIDAAQLAREDAEADRVPITPWPLGDHHAYATKMADDYATVWPDFDKPVYVNAYVETFA